MNKTWTPSEDKVLSNTCIGYDEICLKLPHRSKRSIWSRAAKLGYVRDTNLIRQVNSENQRKDSWTKPLEDKEFCEIIDGELLGDGCVYRKKVKNRLCYEYSFIAGSIHKEYAEYVHDIIAKKINSKAQIKVDPPKTKAGFKSKTFYSVRFSNIVFKSFYQRWYTNGSIKTIVPEDIKLTPTACLHWYLGDGSLDSRAHAHMFDLALHTENFTHKSVERLKSMLQKAFDIKVTVNKSSKIYYKLRVHGNHARKFLSHIGSCPVKCFEYKWRDWK